MSEPRDTNLGKQKPFPEESIFPTVQDFQDYVSRSLDALGITAYRLANEIPGNTNPNVVRNITQGVTKNPTHQTMFQIFTAIERMKREAGIASSSDEGCK